MTKNFILVFDEAMLKQLKKLGSDANIKVFISKMLDKIEDLGPVAGKLLDSQLHIYEMKMNRPPIRLYFKHNIATNEMFIFEYEMKTSSEKQNQTIEKIWEKILEP